MKYGSHIKRSEVDPWAFSDLITGSSRNISRTDSLKYGRNCIKRYSWLDLTSDLVTGNSRSISRTDNLRIKVLEVIKSSTNKGLI